MGPSLTFFLPVDPMPTPRPRFRVIVPKDKRRRPIAVAYNDRDYAKWQKEALAALRPVVPHFFRGPVIVELTIKVRRPKTTKLDAPKPDVDNYAKAVLDVLTKDGRFWSDDTQVVGLCALKTWAAGEPGILITISNP